MLPRRPEPPPSKTPAPLADHVSPDSAHKFCAYVLFATAAVMLVQLTVLATMSDEQLRTILTNTTLYSLLPEEKKVEALRLARQEMVSAYTVAGKSLGALLLGVIGIGLLRGRRKPTRALAVLASILFGVISVFVVLNYERLIRALESSIGFPAWIDLAFAILVPVAFVCCFIASGRKLWKAPTVAVARPRPPLRRDPPAPGPPVSDS